VKPFRLAALALAALTLGGCTVFQQGHPYTESRPYNEVDQGYWRDKSWRDEKVAFWAEEYKRKRAIRMQEYFRD
jgi:hypothetical protein